MMSENNKYYRSKIEQKNEILSFFRDLSIILLMVFLIRTFVIIPFQISGSSMMESYYDKEFIVVNKIWYMLFKEPERWDVVVFDTHIPGREYFIKRIVGIPWDTVKINDGFVYIKTSTSDDFIKLTEDYLSERNNGRTYVRWASDAIIYEVPDGEYFVMGDNRNGSTDSRECFDGCERPWSTSFVKKDNIVWHLLLDLWYFNLRDFEFRNKNLTISTKPRWFSSPSDYDYNLD